MDVEIWEILLSLFGFFGKSYSFSRFSDVLNVICQSLCKLLGLVISKTIWVFYVLKKTVSDWYIGNLVRQNLCSILRLFKVFVKNYKKQSIDDLFIKWLQRSTVLYRFGIECVYALFLFYWIKFLSCTFFLFFKR